MAVELIEQGFQLSVIANPKLVSNARQRSPVCSRECGESRSDFAG
jgi:hypothetical protein